MKAKEWIIGHSGSVNEVFGVLSHHSNDLNAKLYLIYLINDVLHDCLRSRAHV